MDKVFLVKKELENDDVSLVVIDNNNSVTTYHEKGVKNLLKFYDQDNDIILSDFFIGDKIIGKAAAILLVKFQVRHCYARTISQAGLDFLLTHNVDIVYDSLVEKITRRDNSGLMCPLENCVLKADSVEEGLKLLLDFRDSKK